MNEDLRVFIGLMPAFFLIGCGAYALWDKGAGRPSPIAMACLAGGFAIILAILAAGVWRMA